MSQLPLPPRGDLPFGGSSEVVNALENALAHGHEARYVLQLYVTGMRPCSQRAIENIRVLCEEYLKGRYELKIVDIYQQPELAEGAQILAAPTLIKELPLPIRKLIGDMSDEGRVRVALGIEIPGPAAAATPPAAATGATPGTT